MEQLAENGFDIYLHKWERPTKALLNYFKLDDVTIIEASLGGYLAPRATAFDKCIKRVSCEAEFYYRNGIPAFPLTLYKAAPHKFCAVLPYNYKFCITFWKR